MKPIIKKTKDKTLAAAFLGFSLVFYIPIFPPIKFIDVSLIMVTPFFFKRFFRLNKDSYLLLASWFVVVVSTILRAIQGGYFAGDTMVSFLGSVAAFVAFLLLSRFTYTELIVFLKSFYISVMLTSIMSVLTLLGLPTGLEIYRSAYGTAIQGAMGDPNRYGFVLVLALCVYLSFGVFRKNSTIKLFVFLLMFYFIFESNSRQAVLYSGIVLASYLIFLYFSWNEPKKIRMKIIKNKNIFSNFLSICLFISFFIFIVWFACSENLSRFDIVHKFESKSLSYFDDGRYRRLESGFLMILKEKQFLGHGFDSLSLTFIGSSHNSYLDVLVNGGILGVFFFLFFLGARFKKIFFSKNTMTESSNIDDFDFIRLKISQKLIFICCILFMMSLNLNYLIAGYAFLGFLANNNAIMVSNNNAIMV